MKIYCLVVGKLRENCYILVNKDNKAIIIDPGEEAKKIIDFCKNYEVVEVLVTHFHFDHIGALEEITNYYNLEVNTYDRKYFNYEVISNPGHTLDSKSYYFFEDKVMFDGDFLFKGSVGRIDLGGNDLDMKKSLDMIKNYDDDILVYPGHGDSFYLKEEKKNLEIYKSWF